MYDPELPNGFQDADIEMSELIAAGNRSAELRRKGLCDHGWLQGPAGSRDSKVHCNDCGAVFDSFEDAYAAHAAAINGDD